MHPSDIGPINGRLDQLSDAIRQLPAPQGVDLGPISQKLDEIGGKIPPPKPSQQRRPPFEYTPEHTAVARNIYDRAGGTLAGTNPADVMQAWGDRGLEVPPQSTAANRLTKSQAAELASGNNPAMMFGQRGTLAIPLVAGSALGGLSTGQMMGDEDEDPRAAMALKMMQAGRGGW